MEWLRLWTQGRAIVMLRIDSLDTGNIFKNLSRDFYHHWLWTSPLKCAPVVLEDAHIDGYFSM